MRTQAAQDPPGAQPTPSTERAEEIPATSESEPPSTLTGGSLQHESVGKLQLQGDPLRERVDELTREVEALSSENDRLTSLHAAAERAARANEEELRRFERRFDMFWERLSEMERLAEESAAKRMQEAQQYRDEVRRLRASESYRLGHALVLLATWPFRTAQRIVRSVKRAS